MREGRQQQTATLLPDGRVLIAGGLLERRPEVAGPVLDGDVRPGDGQVLDDRLDGCPPYSHTATLLNDGRVLIVGGEDIGNGGGVGVPSAVLYQP